MPDVLESPPASRTSLSIRIAWIWLVIVGIVFLLLGAARGPWVGPTFEKYVMFGLGLAQLWAADFLRKRRRVGVLLAGCAFAVLSSAVFKTTVWPRDALSAIGFTLVMAGVPLGLGLVRWRELM